LLATDQLDELANCGSDKLKLTAASKVKVLKDGIPPPISIKLSSLTACRRRDRVPILVTGGAGYIGSHAVLALKKRASDLSIGHPSH